MEALRVEGLNAFYNQRQVLWDVSFSVPSGTTCVILGPNGAGKTTLLNSFAGLVKRRGEIFLSDRRIGRMQGAKVARQGLALVPEGRGTFTELSVHENLLLGGYFVKDRAKFAERLEYSYELFPILAERQTQLSGTLSGGEQQMLAIARGLMSFPKVMLLDEPSLGLAPNITVKLFEAIKQIQIDHGTTLMIVEQNAHLSLKIADSAHVLENGEIVHSGDAAALADSEIIRKSYLGY